MKRLYSLLLFNVFVLCTVRAQQTFPVNGTADPKHITYVFVHATIYMDYKTSISNATSIARLFLKPQEG